MGMANKLIKLGDGVDTLLPTISFEKTVAGNGSSTFTFPNVSGNAFLALVKRNANNNTDFSMYYGVQTANSFNVIPIKESNDMKLTMTLAGTTVTIQNLSTYYAFIKIIPFYT